MTVRGICLRDTIIIYVQESKAEVQTLSLSNFIFISSNKALGDECFWNIKTGFLYNSILSSE